MVVDVHQQWCRIQQRLGFLPHALMRRGVQRDGQVNVQRLRAGLNDGVCARQKGQIRRHAVLQHGDDILPQRPQAQRQTQHRADCIAIRTHMRHDSNALRRAHRGNDFGSGGVGWHPGGIHKAPPPPSCKVKMQTSKQVWPGGAADRRGIILIPLAHAAKRGIKMIPLLVKALGSRKYS